MKTDENLPLNHGSLFSGIGGFDLASEWTELPFLNGDENQ